MLVIDQSMSSEMNYRVLGEFRACRQAAACGKVQRFELLISNGKARDLVSLLPAESQSHEVQQPRFAPRSPYIINRELLYWRRALVLTLPRDPGIGDIKHGVGKDGNGPISRPA